MIRIGARRGCHGKKENCAPCLHTRKSMTLPSMCLDNNPPQLRKGKGGKIRLRDLKEWLTLETTWLRFS